MGVGGCDGERSGWPEHGGERGEAGSRLTLSQVVPVGGGEKGVAAQALVAQPLPSAAQEALHQVHHDPAGAHLLWELQVPLRVKTEAEVVKETVYRKRDARSRPLFCLRYGRKVSTVPEYDHCGTSV